MTREKKTIYKNLGWISLGLAILIIIFYFISSYGQLTDEGYALEDFAGKTFVTEDRTVAVTFNANVDAATVTTEEAVYKLTLQYTDNIFVLSGSAEYEFIIIDSKTLFGSTGDYFYRGR